jgi:hypothetical protein
MPELSDEELDALAEEATVDAYGDDEQLGGFAVMIEDNLEVPFETTVLGVTVTVQKVTQTESGIVADCVRDGHHQAISVLDLGLPEQPPKGAQWTPPTGTGRVACEGVQGVKMSWVELDRIVSEEMRRHERTGATCASLARRSTLPSRCWPRMRRSLGRPVTDRAGNLTPKPTRRHWTRYRDGMSRERGGSERRGRSGNRRAWVLRLARMDCPELAKASHISRTTRTTCG